jgi:hypothetical protein
MTIKPLSTAALAAAMGLPLLGCEVQHISQVGQAPREAISYAATAHYPGNATTSPSVHAAAVADPDAHELTIYNLSDNGIPGSTVWVNGAVVHQIAPIPPRGSATVDYSQFLQAGEGVKTLRQLDQPVSKVELQTAEGLFAVEGPARR